MARYLKPTEALIQEYLGQFKTPYGPKNEANLRQRLKLPNGHRDASRLHRNAKTGKLLEEAPWMFAEFFSF